MQLGTDDRLDTRFTRQREELHRAVKVRIGDRQRFDAALDCRLDDRRDGKRGVEEAVVALDVERHEVAHPARRWLGSERRCAPLRIRAGLIFPLLQPEIVAAHDRVIFAQPIEHAGEPHRRINAKLARFVARGGDDAAPFAADRDRLASQLRISGLLDGREEGVGVEMDDHRRRRVKRSDSSNCSTNGPRARPHQRKA